MKWFLILLVVLTLACGIVPPVEASSGLFEDCCFYSGLTGCCYVVMLDLWWHSGGDWPGW